MLLSIALMTSAHALPMELTHQGRLLDVAGVPLVGTEPVTFALYPSTGAATPLWSETLNVDFDQGYFAATLGSDLISNPLEDAVFDSAELYVALTVGSGAEGPRQRITSVPYAVRAKTATDVIGGVVDVSEVRINGNTVLDAGGLVGGTMLSDLACANDQVPLYNGVVWGCANVSGGGGLVTWDDVAAKPADFADGVDDDAIGDLICSDQAVARWNSLANRWECAVDGTLTESEVESFVVDGALDFAVGSSVDGSPIVTSANLDAQLAAAGSVDLASGSTLDGMALVTDWTNLPSIPAGFADGVDDDTQLTEAEVDAFVANNGYAADADISVIGKTGMWSDLLGVPAGFADGTDDDTQLTEAQVETFVTNGALDLDAGTTIGGQPVAGRNIVWSTGSTYTSFLTVSTSWQTIPDLDNNPINITTSGGPIRFGWRGNFDCDNSNCSFYLRIIVDGAVCGNVNSNTGFGRIHDNSNSDIYAGYHVEGICNVSAGTHTVQAQYRMANASSSYCHLRHHSDMGHFLLWAEEL